MAQTNLRAVKADSGALRLDEMREKIQEQSLAVLVVEDDPMSRTFMQKIMGRLGVEADFAIDGLEAMRLYNRNTYDLIFMDIQMPVMNGYETTKLIREQEQLTNVHTPIIAITAYALEEDREKCLNAGMDDYLSKPVSVDHLLRVIAERC
ncbi:response regulator [Anoxynatronum buryatiense]|uniref:Stage 0 sporulation protein A homolog n=1 Tax=Anoxynatronum buryatiense TaxID=489973 RepID=A0AA45WYK0_9CLOT|nr:response regulator [Anoxynatronum buryatiense]SMP67835.1 Response regulator receiver domain-containing protein [Anoxynatronum buryatiense]